MPNTEQEQALLTRFDVEGLFGRYDYRLDVPSQAVAERLVLFYGDNGTGKTTILRLLWHLLSPANNRGHRTALRHIPFRRVRVELSDGASLEVEKTRGLTSPFTIKLTTVEGHVSVSDWGAEQEPDVFDGWDTADIHRQLKDLPKEFRRSAEIELERRFYIAYLVDLGVKPYYLADDRNIYSDELLEDEPRSPAEAARRRTIVRNTSPDQFQGIVAQELASSMRRASDMLQQLALGGATSGSASANSVYLEVLQRLTYAAATTATDLSEVCDRLVAQLGKVGRRSRAFEDLGLVPTLPSDAFVDALHALPPERVSIADEVLTPYLSSLTARLDALQDAQSLIQTFLDQANGFLINKRLMFEPQGGLMIQLDDEEWLGPSQLSSGERQLVLLLCNALLARRGTRLFLIDEPELSLNAKWQRNIVPALLACTDGTPVQFLIATHSIELLSSYRSNIVRLEETHGGE